MGTTARSRRPQLKVTPPPATATSRNTAASSSPSTCATSRSTRGSAAPPAPPRLPPHLPLHLVNPAYKRICNSLFSHLNHQGCDFLLITLLKLRNKCGSPDT